VTEFLRPQREHRKPAQNRYFTSAEAEAGDPLCIEDPAGETTDTESDLRSGWDEDDKDEDAEFDPDVDIEDIEMVQKDHHMSP
jgi:hypothetical protein